MHTQHALLLRTSVSGDRHLPDWNGGREGIGVLGIDRISGMSGMERTAVRQLLVTTK
jgi:hypothetical protein